MNSQPSFRIIPLSLATVAAARGTRRDCLGHRLAPQVNHEAGNPCRFTLRMVQPGEEMILMSYSPFRLDHPYREIGPVFIAAHGETGYTDVHRFPPEIDPVTRVFRSYDAAEQIVAARVGTPEPTAIIAELFANPRTDCIHVRSLTYGCYTFKIERA